MVLLLPENELALNIYRRFNVLGASYKDYMNLELDEDEAESLGDKLSLLKSKLTDLQNYKNEQKMKR